MNSASPYSSQAEGDPNCPRPPCGRGPPPAAFSTTALCRGGKRGWPTLLGGSSCRGPPARETAMLREEDSVLPSPDRGGQGWCQWGGDPADAAWGAAAPQGSPDSHLSMGSGSSPHCLNLCGATSQRFSSAVVGFLLLLGRALSPPHPAALSPHLPSPTPTSQCPGFPYSTFSRLEIFTPMHALLVHARLDPWGSVASSPDQSARVVLPLR